MIDMAWFDDDGNQVGPRASDFLPKPPAEEPTAADWARYHNHESWRPGTEGYSLDDTREEAWEKYFDAHPEVLANWGYSNGRWPMNHPILQRYDGGMGEDNGDGTRTHWRREL
jgi:hypothetical protein